MDRTIARERRLSCNHSILGFSSGSSFVEKMHQATLKCERLLAVLSWAYFESEYCRAEWQTYWASDPVGTKGLILPVRIDDCDPEGLLKSRTYVDLYGVSEKEARNRLLAAVAGKRLKPLETLSFWPQAKTPKALPPRLRNRLFIDRPEISELRALLIQQGTVALVGQAGVGKTELAIEYVYRHSQDVAEYSPVLWVAAETEALASNYAKLSDTLGIPITSGEPLEIVNQKIRAKIETLSEYLLVFDNAEDPQLLTGYLPRTGGHIVITSLNPEWSSLAAVIKVGPFTPNQALEFLLKRTGLTDSMNADTLIEITGSNPLLLELVGADIAESHVSFARYSGYADIEELWREAEKPITYDRVVRTVFSRLVAKLTPEHQWLLTFFAFLSSTDIPISLIKDLSKVMPKHLASKVRGYKDVIKAVKAMQRYSLIEKNPNEEALSIHRSIQTTIRAELDKPEIIDWINRTIEVLSTLTDKFALVHLQGHTVTSEVVKTHDPLRLSVIEVLLHTQSVKIRTRHVALLINYWVEYLIEWAADYTNAERIARYGCEVTNFVYGEISDHASTALNVLGIALFEQGRHIEAIETYHKSLDIKLAINPEDTEVVIGYINIADAYRESGDLKSARTWYKTAQERLGQFPDPHRFLLLTSMIHKGIGDIEYLQGKYRKAVAEYEEAIGLAYFAFGHIDRRLEYLYYYYGRALVKAGNKRKGTEFLTKSLELAKALDPKHLYSRRQQEIEEFYERLKK